ncbi:CLUMA_CG019272, isoform A [Clunio marinus]|uniref:CLUMA_CG019272, isoform A n=1 Tax=Clunio marinus TaxID=568069 RepID=A0A1J1J1Y6_9DIPT|nr:CLUMA_CG019272, isoform A [Clunio marinus]
MKLNLKLNCLNKGRSFNMSINNIKVNTYKIDNSQDFCMNVIFCLNIQRTVLRCLYDWIIFCQHL